MRQTRFLAVLTVLAALTAVAPRSLAAVIDKIVAVVNDEVITQREVAAYLMPYLEQYKKEYTGRGLERKMLEAEDEVIDELIEDKLVLSEAKRQGISVEDKDIEAKLETIKNSFETEEEFRGKLAEQNISLSELRDRIRNDLMKQQLIRKTVGVKIMITPIEAREYYEAHMGDYTKPAKVRAMSILVKKDKRGRTEEEARFLMENIKKLLEEGQDFAELAKEYSEGPHADEGGALGLVEKGQMMKEIDDAIFALAEGETSGIVESPLGYHIFKAVEILPAETADFQSVKDEIDDLIYRDRIGNSLKEWLKELRRNAYISVK